MTVKPVNWPDRKALLLLHEESLATFGGARGLRDEGLLDSALARGPQKLAYEPDSDIAALAAALAYGITRNHPFIDGNKRAGLLVLGLMLAVNGLRLTAPQTDVVMTMLAVASGQLTEDALAAFIRAHSAPYEW